MSRPPGKPAAGHLEGVSERLAYWPLATAAARARAGLFAGSTTVQAFISVESTTSRSPSRRASSRMCFTVAESVDSKPGHSSLRRTRKCCEDSHHSATSRACALGPALIRMYPPRYSRDTLLGRVDTGSHETIPEFADCHQQPVRNIYLFSAHRALSSGICLPTRQQSGFYAKLIPAMQLLL
jgi:hypothetical protein